MMDALEFDQGDDDMHGDELGRNPAEAESYFSSRIHSSSETFSSEMMLAYQQALRMNGGAPLPGGSQLGAGASGLRSKARKDRGGNTVIEQDKSGAGGVHSKIRVPTLDFNILHSNQEQEMNQEE